MASILKMILSILNHSLQILKIKFSFKLSISITALFLIFQALKMDQKATDEIHITSSYLLNKALQRL